MRRYGEAGAGEESDPSPARCHLMLGGEVWGQVLASRGEERDRLVKEEVQGEEPSVSFVTMVPVHVCETVLGYLVSSCHSPCLCDPSPRPPGWQ